MSEEVPEIDPEESERSSEAEGNEELPIGPDESDDEEPLEPDDKPEHTQEVSLVNSIISKKGRKRSRMHELEDQDEEMIDKVLQEMQRAADEDLESFQQGKPGVKKLANIDRFVKFLKISRYHETMLIMNCCLVFHKWLSQMPDYSFPSLAVRSKLLEVMQDIPISKENLSESGLGKSVYAIYKNPMEKPEVKRMAKALIDKWYRQIYHIDTDYAQARKYEAIGDPDEPEEKQEINLNKLLQQKSSSKFTRIPVKGQFDFRVLPRPRLPKERSGRMGESSSEKLKKQFQLKKKNPARKNNSEMSVDGRNLNA